MHQKIGRLNKTNKGRKLTLKILYIYIINNYYKSEIFDANKGKKKDKNVTKFLSFLK